MDGQGTLVRRLLREASGAALATLDQQGAPHASLVTVACDLDATPILLLSQLSAHTVNLGRDGRASLLITADNPRRNPQTGARITVKGTVSLDPSLRLARRYLARHPSAKGYARFADFGFYRFEITSLQLVAGFGRAGWIERDQIHPDRQAIEAFTEGEEALLGRLNGAENPRLVALAQQVFASKAEKWRAVAADPDGLDLRCGPRVRRINLERPVSRPEDLIAAALGR